MIGRRVRQLEVEESSQRKRIGGAPRNRPLRIEALEVPDQQQPKIPARLQPRSPHGRRIKSRAQTFDEFIEWRVVQDPIQSLIERVRRRRRQVRPRDPHARLTRPALRLPMAMRESLRIAIGSGE
jgi:hypothetical protein